MDTYISSLQKARSILGSYDAIGAACGGLSGKAVIKWKNNGRPPRTEYTGETEYAALIESATQGKVTREELLPSLVKDKKQ
jgi:DNA-binding transcriptional regulator YdaS (Cro superfamily)